jgi:CheY-like chemotaxis protein
MALKERSGLVLVVDDDDDIRESLEVLLRLHGYHVATAADGAEALARLQNDPTRPCLILLDLMMPRLSGNEFRRAQLGDPTVSAVPVAVMSGATDVEQRAQALGAVATLAKPIDFEMLIEIVRRYCA